MPHNLKIVDYGLGQPGSVHDAYAFQATCTAREHETVLPHEHWIWADSAYPLQRWCAVPFKKPRGKSLSCRQNTYNCYVSKIHTFSPRPTPTGDSCPDKIKIDPRPCGTCICSPERTISVTSGALFTNADTSWLVHCGVLGRMLLDPPQHDNRVWGAKDGGWFPAKDDNRLGNKRRITFHWGGWWWLSHRGRRKRNGGATVLFIPYGVTIQGAEPPVLGSICSSVDQM